MCSRPPYLPPELVGKIIQCLRAEQGSLGDCVLVCREWALIAYTYHFALLRYVAREADLSPPETHQTPLSRANAYSFADLFAFLQHAPMVCQSVHDLRLETTTYSNTLDLVDLDATIALLPKLRRLNLSAVWHARDHIPRAYPPTACLEQLVLRGAVQCTPAEMAALLDLFAGVDRVVFDDASLLPLREDSPIPKLAIKAAVVSTIAQRIFLTWVACFLPFLDPNILKSLLVIIPDTSVKEPMKGVMDTVGHGLESLTYGLIDRDHTTPLATAPCSNLRSLTVVVFMPCRKDTPHGYGIFLEGSWPAALQTLVDAPSSLQSICLHITVFRSKAVLLGIKEKPEKLPISLPDLAGQLEALDWSLLGSAITNHTNVEKFTVKIPLYNCSQAHGSSEDAKQFVASVERMLRDKCFKTEARRTLLYVDIFG